MKAKLIFLLTVILSLTSCQKYEDFIEDYDYSTTYLRIKDLYGQSFLMIRLLK